MPKNWFPELSLEQIQALQISYVNSMVVRSSKEIWFVVNGPKPLQLARYLIGPKEITTYKIELPSGESYVPGKVFLSRIGEIWGINPVNVTPGVTRENYLLNKYDDPTDKFLPYPYKDGMQLDGEKIKDIDSDHNGNLWLVVYGIHNGISHNFLVKVDIRKNKVIHIDALDPFDIISLAIDNEDQAWLLVRTNENINRVLQYDPLTNKLKDYGVPPIEEFHADTQGIFIENNNRIWISNKAWLEIDTDGQTIWYITILPAAFVAPSVDPFGGITYQWWHDSPSLQDQRGILWFGYPAVVTLNPLSGEWCLVHRSSGVIAEDEEGNVWIFSGSQLYKYQQ
jgi:hypothetical protein